MLRDSIPRAKASSAYQFFVGRWVNRRYLRDPARVVNSLYRAAFGRRAEPEGLANRIQQLQSGVPLEILAEELVCSPEFQARHGTSQTVDAKYLRAVYRDGLRRKPDQEGLAQWIAAGGKGATRAQVLAAFATSEEALEKAGSASADPARIWDPSLLVNSLFKTAFGRDADAAELADGIQDLQLERSLEDLAERLVASAEFQARHGSSPKIDFKYLTALFRDGLGRQPDLASVAFWFTQGNDNGTRATVLAGIAGSDEARERVHQSKVDRRTAYNRWIAANDTISDADRAAIRVHIAGLPFQPLISVIMPISKTSETALQRSFNSILTQLYPYWELCIGADAFANPLWTALLSGQMIGDHRIRVAQSARIKGCAAATNEALNMATGEFVAFLQAGDLLPEHALYEVALAFGANPHADIVYTDQDQIDAAGQRFSPWFKPGWDPDLLLARDYISSLAVFRYALVDRIGALRPGFEGAEFHDLTLRATAATTPDRILHIPAILSHVFERETAIHSENAVQSLCDVAASHRAVRDHLDSRGDTGAVLKPAAEFPSAIHVLWPLPQDPPLVSVIIPTRDRADLLAQCVDGILHRTDYVNLELVIVDYGDSEPASHRLFDRLKQEDSRVRILRHAGAFNYSALNNAAAREANGEILVLLKNEIDVIAPGWLRELVSHALRPDVGIAGAKLLLANGQEQDADMVAGPGGARSPLVPFSRRKWCRPLRSTEVAAHTFSCDR
jgi:glycosyltransferase involved in cell wall biosynthesis